MSIFILQFKKERNAGVHWLSKVQVLKELINLRQKALPSVTSKAHSWTDLTEFHSWLEWPDWHLGPSEWAITLDSKTSTFHYGYRWKNLKSPDQATIVERCLEKDTSVLLALLEKGHLEAGAKVEKALLTLVQVQMGRQRNTWRILLLGDLKIEMYGPNCFIMMKATFMIRHWQSWSHWIEDKANNITWIQLKVS